MDQALIYLIAPSYLFEVPIPGLPIVGHDHKIVCKSFLSRHDDILVVLTDNYSSFASG